VDLFNDKLGNTITLFNCKDSLAHLDIVEYYEHTFKIFIRKIEKQNKDNATVIRVNNTGTSVNHEFGCWKCALVDDSPNRSWVFYQVHCEAPHVHSDLQARQLKAVYPPTPFREPEWSSSPR
jgi:hypothetical protein